MIRRLLRRLWQRIRGHKAVAAIRPDPSVAWGTWEGWGTSLAWWANVYGAREELISAFFTLETTQLQGRDLPGLGLTIARYNAGGCAWKAVDGQQMQVSPNIPPWKQIHGFWIDGADTDPDSSSWDWNVDENQRAVLTAAKDAGANTFELFSNSPMWWMLQNHNPSGADDGGDNLRPDQYQRHTIYLATIAERAREHWGIEFTSVDAFNEPRNGRWNADGTQEGCHFSVDAQNPVIPFLRAELNSRSLQDIIVSASDEVNYDSARYTWGNLTGDARTAVARVNVHGYQYEGGRRDLLYNEVHEAGKKLWTSEYGENDTTGMRLAQNLSLDMWWLHPTAWVYWQAIDENNWGLISGNQDTATLGEVNVKYYVLAQYTRHIRPGLRIISSGDSGTVAAYDAGRRELSLVAANPGTEANQLSYDLSAFSSVGPVARCWETRADGSRLYEKQPDVRLSGKSLTANSAAGSVQTLVVSGIEI